MRTAAFILTLSCAVAAPARAETVRAGAKGGLFCTDGPEIIALIERQMKGQPLALGASCKTIPSETIIEASSYENLTDEIGGGIGSIAGGKLVAFLIWRDAPTRTSVGRTFKRVSPNDVRNTPTKWQGRDIEFANVNVYWVSADDVRILTGTNVTLFAGKTRSAENSYFSEQCETEAEALSRKCKATVRFRYDEHGEDQPSGLLKRTVLKSSDVELIRPPSGRR